MNYLRLLLFLSLAFGQFKEYPEKVELFGTVFHDMGGFIYEVENCLVSLEGLGEKYATMTDSSGYFSFTVDISRDFYLFDVALPFYFNAYLEDGRPVSSIRKISPRTIDDTPFDIGHIYLKATGDDELTAKPTVWDLLEDSLLFLRRQNQDLQN